MWSAGRPYGYGGASSGGGLESSESSDPVEGGLFNECEKEGWRVEGERG